MGKEANEFVNKQSNINKNVDRQVDKQRSPRPEQKRPQFTQKRYTDTRNIKPQSIVSIVIPLYNEEDSLPELSLQLESELAKITNNRYEVIFIDDGSTDNSFSVLQAIHKRNNKFKAIRFRRNHGKSAALAVGFAEARGFIIITMDADLQDDPAEISKLIDKIKEGYDLVSGWKKKRYDPIIKTVTSKIYNFATSIMSGIKLHDFNCGLKAYKREVAKSLQVYGEMHRYLPALAYWEGFKVTEIPVKHHRRRYGKSKYGPSRFVKGFLDLLTVLFTTRYLKRPLHFFGTLGTLFAIIGLVIDGYLTVEWFLGNTFLSNRPLALFGIAMIIVGVQLISMGLLGEMIVKNSRAKQYYSIKERL